MEMQIKTTLRYHFILLEWQSSQIQKTKDVEELEHLMAVDGL